MITGIHNSSTVAFDIWTGYTRGCLQFGRRCKSLFRDWILEASQLVKLLNNKDAI